MPVRPPKKQDKQRKRRKHHGYICFLNCAAGVKRIDCIRMNLNAAHLLTGLGKRREPLVVWSSFSREADENDLIRELCEIASAIQHLPGGNVPEAVVVAHETNVDRLGAKHIRCTSFLLEICFERHAGAVQRLYCECGYHTAGTGRFCGEDSATDVIEIRIGMNVSEPNVLLKKKRIRFQPTVCPLCGIDVRRQHNRARVRNHPCEGVVGIGRRSVTEEHIDRDCSRFCVFDTIDQPRQHLA